MKSERAWLAIKNAKEVIETANCLLADYYSRAIRLEESIAIALTKDFDYHSKKLGVSQYHNG